MTESFRVQWTEPTDDTAKPKLVSPPKPHLDFTPPPSPSGWHKSRLTWPQGFMAHPEQCYIHIDDKTGEFYRLEIEQVGENRWRADVVHDLEDAVPGGRYYTSERIFFTASQAKVWCESMVLADDCPPIYGDIT